ncbi:kinase-like protein, partial [Fistulina hepatica ATCC 64428]
SLRAESELLKDLKHPNITEYLDMEETNAILTLYTTYMAGGSVRSLTEVYGAIQEKTAKAFTIQLLCGLAFLESHKIVHGNADSTNILVSNRGECQLSGFSLAKRIPAAASDVTGVYGGDITYAAPEAVTGTFGVKNDVWSLGCVFQELVSKHRPWDGKDSAIVSENVRMLFANSFIILN